MADPDRSGSAASILDVNGLTMRFGGLLAVDRIDLSVPRGKILALIGPNGAGKSTTVNLLSGVLTPTAGTSMLDGAPITGLKPHRIADAGLVRTFQNGRLFHRLSVVENIMVGAGRTLQNGFLASVLRTPGFRRSEAEKRERAMALLDGLGLADAAMRNVYELPYGKQRKLEIARALILEPRVLMLDEPAAGLNSGEVEDLIVFVSDLRAKGLSILLIEHNMGLVMRLADRITVLNFGKKIADGTPEDIASNETVIEAYLGRKGVHAAV